eukprot:scaffold25958_cov88-Phaeocystis_antarctica.AAC.3
MKSVDAEDPASPGLTLSTSDAHSSAGMPSGSTALAPSLSSASLRPMRTCVVSVPCVGGSNVSVDICTALLRATCRATSAWTGAANCSHSGKPLRSATDIVRQWVATRLCVPRRPPRALLSPAASGRPTTLFTESTAPDR